MGGEAIGLPSPLEKDRLANTDTTWWHRGTQPFAYKIEGIQSCIKFDV